MSTFSPLRSLCPSSEISEQTRTLESTLWLKRMRLLCKRGNLESEFLLQSYLESLQTSSASTELRGQQNESTCIQALAPDFMSLFETLLQETEQNLFCWLMKHNPQQPQQTIHIPEKYRPLIEDIRANYLK
ncbi:MAG: succinate dehydrogenase assembly factor 2 [Gammaproteobacteria bacterium]|nr:succinate dehydrogenase assembly factor 2 [Gammaproteobacteria bacterium]